MKGFWQSIFEEALEEEVEKMLAKEVGKKEEELIMKKYSKGVPREDIAEFLEISMERVNAVISQNQKMLHS